LIHCELLLLAHSAVARRRCCWSSLAVARAPASCRAPAAREGRSRPSAQGAAAASGQRCSRGGASAASTGRGGSSFELGSADRMPSAVTANCASPGPPPLERAARRTPSHPSRLTCMLHKCAHASPSAGTSPLVGAGGHLVDEHDDARCARRAAWLRSCAICPTSCYPRGCARALPCGTSSC
jgi:hypothetical protein